ncbi:MAG TPA: sigma-54 dependent transcriptional regulator [Myxococcales bacterium]|jgi:DNA-binding NtrC family response regulator|nr:sigma-54 dependent transcriptional regulator [Myxococcales bacterium]
MARAATVLIADDDGSMRQTMEAIVRSAGMRPITVASGEEALRAVQSHPVDVMLLDVQMPGIGGLEVLRQVREKHTDIGVIMISVLKEVPVAVEAMRLGALDYVTKDFSPTELNARVAKTLEQLKSARELAWLREEQASRDQKPMVLGHTAAMRTVAGISEKIASKPVTVLITGESGTGKEMLARYIHEHSDRRSGPFVAVNLPAVPESLVESQLFGHEKGSFTGATKLQFGKFELASGGTLFLDEIGELKLDVQAKLLRALQEHEIERVGGARPIQLDLRVICATNRSLPEMIKEGRFREDLYYRLNVVPIQVPPLRERREDIRELALHFLARSAVQLGRIPQTLSDGAAQLLETYAWPGNIRELQNLLERMAVLCESQIIEESDLPLEFVVAAGLRRDAERETSLQAAMSAFERGFLKKTLVQNAWNRRRTAENLGIGYSTLKSKLKAYGIGSDDED